MKKLNQTGFTLVELMVVVAIIGVLAGLAIPQYRRFTAKARASEAKVVLSSARTALESGRAENGVTSCLRQAGFQIGNSPVYAVGFNAAANGVGALCGPANNQACNIFSGWTAAAPSTCAVADTQAAATRSADGHAVATVAQLTATATITAGAAGAGANYQIMAAGGISTLAAFDTWTIDQNGNLSNTIVGY